MFHGSAGFVDLNEKDRCKCLLPITPSAHNSQQLELFLLSSLTAQLYRGCRQMARLGFFQTPVPRLKNRWSLLGIEPTSAELHRLAGLLKDALPTDPHGRGNNYSWNIEQRGVTIQRWSAKVSRRKQDSLFCMTWTLYLWGHSDHTTHSPPRPSTDRIIWRVLLFI